MLRIEQDGRLCRIALAAPEKRNALDALACRELLHELKDADADGSIGAILLEADGPVFCAGAEPDHEALFEVGRTATKPIIAAVQGVAISGGLALTANAHVVVAAQGTSFGLPEIREGKWNGAAVDALQWALGRRRATELAITARIFSTPEALAWGLVHYVAPPFELDDRASEIATALANANPEVMKQALARLGSGGC